MKDLTPDQANEVVLAIADLLTMTGHAQARRRTSGGRVAVAFTVAGAAPGRSVSLAVDTIMGTAFTVAPIESGKIVDDQVEMTRSPATLVPLLSRAFSWARTRTVQRNRRRTSRRASRRTSRRSR